MAWYEFSTEQGNRIRVAKQLEKEGLLSFKDKDETATAFWERVEEAGLLQKALDFHDELAKKDAAEARVRRETKKMFAARIQREGRQAKVEEKRKELMESGLPLRDIHQLLVLSFQPLDGSETQAWTTPNPWEAGRLCRKKEEQERLLRQEDPDGYQDSKASNDSWRLECLKWRREERNALVNARRRALELKSSSGRGS
jgi:hypothetical protein